MVNAICFRCGSGKTTPLSKCPCCGRLPASDEQLALSLMLTPTFLSSAELSQASGTLKGGRLVTVPSHLRSRVQAAVRQAKRHGVPVSPVARRQLPRALKFTVGTTIGLLVLWLTGWPYYGITRLRNSE